MTSLETASLSKRFGGVVALDNVCVDFPAGAVTAIIGPNGAGKTTLFNAIAGLIQPESGAIHLLDEARPGAASQDLVGLAPHEIANKGVGVLFQDVRVFSKMTALENVAVGIKDLKGEVPLRAILEPRLMRREKKEVDERSMELLRFVGIAERCHETAGSLSYGQQKLVALARVLAGGPKVLLLDEPTAGIDPAMVDHMLALVSHLASTDGCAVGMIEHNLNVVRRVGDWLFLMANGRVEVFGEPGEVLRDKTLVEAFPTL